MDQIIEFKYCEHEEKGGKIGVDMTSKNVSILLATPSLTVCVDEEEEEEEEDKGFQVNVRVNINFEQVKDNCLSFTSFVC